MKIKSFLIILITTLICPAAADLIYAKSHDTEINNSSGKKYRVNKGYVDMDNVIYPVYMKVNEVQKLKSGGITYRIPVKDVKSAKALAVKIYNFYTLKKINRVVVSKFSRVDKPDTIAWYSRKCEKKSDDGIQLLVKIINNSVTVFIIPSCNEDLLSEIL